jgi:hypothetical protein
METIEVNGKKYKPITLASFRRNEQVWFAGHWYEPIEEKPKDWDVLSVQGRDGSILNKENYTFPECFQTLVNAKDIFTIHSVKRTSDGEVFTVGDRVERNNNPEKMEILSIHINDTDSDTLYFKTSDGGEPNIMRCSKVRIRPVFTTNNGIDIYEGSDYYGVNTKLWTIWVGICKEKTKVDSFVKTFSSREAAEEYLLFNKPLLSLNDLLNSWDDDFTIPPETYKTAPLFKRFLEAAKAKLKQ